MQLDDPGVAGTLRKNASDIIEWLASDECHELEGTALIDRLGDKLCKAGLPLQRMVFHVRTLHPTLLGRAIAWAPEEPVAFLDIQHAEEQSAQIQKSPVFHVVSTRTWLMLRMDDPRWLLGDLFLRRGLAELIIAPIVHGTAERAVSAVTFGTGRPTGFSAAEQAFLRRIVPALRGAIELKMWRRTTMTLLDTYIGMDAEKRVLSGHIRRGDVETLEAALMFCDMRGFTELSNRLSGPRVLELLNIYFDEVSQRSRAAVARS